MFKRLAYSICFIVCAISASAQTMKWLCEPQYDDIKVLNKNLYLVAKDGKYGILDESGTLIYSLKYDDVTPFQEGRALLLIKGKSGFNEIAGIIDEDGNIVRSLEGRGYIASFEYPYYNEGKMVYVTSSNGKKGAFLFGYLDMDGKEHIPAKFLYAAPFFNGKATVRMASSGEFGVINSSGTTAIFTDKPLLFLSSIVDGQAVGWRNSRNGGELVLLKLKGDTFSVAKTLAQGYGEARFPNGNFSKLSYGYDTFEFDAALRYVGRNSSVERSPIALPVYPAGCSSSLAVTDGGSLKGVSYNGKEILLPQFADVIPLTEKVAVAVETHGRRGLLTLNENTSVSFLEKDKEFEFRSGEQPELSWDMELNGIAAEYVSVKLKSELSGASSLLYVAMGDSGRYKIVFPYEFKSRSEDRAVTETFQADLCVDGLEVSSERLSVSYVYRRLLKNVGVSAPEYTESDGFADVKVNISVHEALTPSGKAIVKLSSGESKTLSLSGRKSGSVSFRVSVPEDETRTLTFNVSVTDGDNCPASNSTGSFTIKNYYLQ